MIRRSESNWQALVRECQRNARAAAAALSSADGRWAVVSTTMTALVAGTIAVLAVGAAPPASAGLSKRDHSLLPYQLFMQLRRIQDPTRRLRASLRRRTAQQANLSAATFLRSTAQSLTRPRTTCIRRPSTRAPSRSTKATLVGALTEQGVSQEDASGAVMAMSSGLIIRARSVPARRSTSPFDASADRQRHRITTSQPPQLTPCEPTNLRLTKF